MWSRARVSTSTTDPKSFGKKIKTGLSPEIWEVASRVWDCTRLVPVWPHYMTTRDMEKLWQTSDLGDINLGSRCVGLDMCWTRVPTISSDKASRNTPPRGCRVLPLFKSNLLRGGGNEPELQQYPYVQIPLQIWTPLVTYDSMKMPRQWKVPLGVTTSLHTVIKPIPHFFLWHEFSHQNFSWTTYPSND